MMRAAVKALRKHARACQMERELEQEHESRKAAIDDFFGNLRDKAREEEERILREHEEQQRQELERAIAMSQQQKREADLEERRQRLAGHRHPVERLER